MKNKKWAVIVLSGLLLLTACTGNNTGSSSNSGNNKEKEQTNVVIAVQSTSQFLETAAAKFETLHPEINIEIKEYLAVPKAEGNGMGAAISQADMEKYVQTVTTQVMSGKGTDLIAMNSLPQDKFAEKKLLVNMYDLMAKDASFDKGKFYENILEASQDGDGLYAMPFAFSIEAMQGDINLLNEANVTIDDKTWTWDQFKEITKKLQHLKGSDYVGLINMFPNQMIADYIESNYAVLVPQGKANFDSDTFRSMMKQIKEMYDEGTLEAEFRYDYEKSLFRFTSPEYAVTMPANIQLFQKPTVNGKSQGSSFDTYFSLGINSKSKVQEEAWKFITFLLSDEMQASPELIGLPLNKSVVENKLTAFTQQANMDAASATERINTVKKLLEGAGERQFSDMKVVSIAMEEFESYMSGQKSAEEVSKLIQNRVNLYLNE